VKLLLDTHTFVWMVSQPQRVGQAAKALATPTENELLVSAATPWEMSIKFHSGKWPEVGPLLIGFQALVGQLNALELPMTSGHGIRAGALEWAHKDPFDRMIAAQALTEGAILLSADLAFDACPDLTRIW
jgi:PIN domain nuclease of toxin-antitoxin system